MDAKDEGNIMVGCQRLGKGIWLDDKDLGRGYGWMTKIWERDTVKAKDEGKGDGWMLKMWE